LTVPILHTQHAVTRFGDTNMLTSLNQMIYYAALNLMTYLTPWTSRQAGHILKQPSWM